MAIFHLIKKIDRFTYIKLAILTIILKIDSLKEIYCYGKQNMVNATTKSGCHRDNNNFSCNN